MYPESPIPSPPPSSPTELETQPLQRVDLTSIEILLYAALLNAPKTTARHSTGTNSLKPSAIEDRFTSPLASPSNTTALHNISTQAGDSARFKRYIQPLKRSAPDDLPTTPSAPAPRRSVMDLSEFLNPPPHLGPAPTSAPRPSSSTPPPSALTPPPEGHPHQNLRNISVSRNTSIPAPPWAPRIMRHIQPDSWSNQIWIRRQPPRARDLLVPASSRRGPLAASELAQTKRRIVVDEIDTDTEIKSESDSEGSIEDSDETESDEEARELTMRMWKRVRCE